MKIGSEVYHHLKKVINNRFGLDATAVGDEGGFAPNILNNKDGEDLFFNLISYRLILNINGKIDPNNLYTPANNLLLY